MKEQIKFKNSKFDQLFDKVVVLMKSGLVPKDKFVTEMEWIYNNCRHDSDNE